MSSRKLSVKVDVKTTPQPRLGSKDCFTSVSSFQPAGSFDRVRREFVQMKLLEKHESPMSFDCCSINLRPLLLKLHLIGSAERRS